jgi:hypothetical protein
MPRTTSKTAPPRKRRASYRERMFAAKCRRQARAIAAGDPAGKEIMRFLEGVRDWPER